MKESDASILAVGLFSVYEHKAKPASETKRSVVEVGHGPKILLTQSVFFFIMFVKKS